MKYRITNTGETGKAYYNDRGDQIYVEPGETIVRKSRPAGNNGWAVEPLEETKPSVTDNEPDDEGGEND